MTDSSSGGRGCQKGQNAFRTVCLSSFLQRTSALLPIGELPVPDDTAPPQPQAHSELFTLRLWRDGEQTDATAPYMQVRHVLTGETRYFSAWPPLIEYLLGKLDSLYLPKET